ncbi:MAG: ATP-dependent Clp protease ATP-binding subunit, partial [bacterium]|nr:ATP-dependent Clp protease ATP-binding subunit [bacterium]
RTFFTGNVIEVLTNISLYLYKFDTKILNFTRTERQTFIFILENIIDYFKTSRADMSSKEEKSLFMDYRFWIENFFKILDQKLTGTVYSSKKVNFKNFFHADDSIKNQLFFSNSSSSFTLSPFLLIKGNQNLFLADVTGEHLLYKDIDFEKEILIKSKVYDTAVFEFLVSNFEFKRGAYLVERVEVSDYTEWFDVFKRAAAHHREHRFRESYDILKSLALDGINLPLVHLLQIKNLVNLNRIFEVKQLMQKFVLLYPYYVDVYEIMGDIYQSESNFELAVNFYEKVLLLTQNKRVAEKLKKVRESMVKNKSKPAQPQSEYFFDITSATSGGDGELLSRLKEQRQMTEILISDYRRNLMLVGDSGVGKTALIRLLAQQIMAGDVPDKLKEKRLKEINFVSLLTGSKYRGQFEEKALKLLSDFKGQKAILILEDIHLMMSAGAARGTSMDFVNILKGFLRENSIQVIATTNYEEYKNVIEKDNALMGFFQKIKVNDMDKDDSKLIVNNLAKAVFDKEKIQVSGSVIEAIVESAGRDIRDKKLPDSAVMLFERAVSKARLKAFAVEPEKCEVEQQDVAEVLSDILNLPQSDISVSLKDRLKTLQNEILSQIVGQDKAIGRIAANVITSKLDFDIKPNRPDGVFLFIGPTGVGKTETAIALAKALYGSEDYLIRIDMSEYMEKFTYSRFVGAAPGYVGYMDSNQLTDKVRQNPYSIILLDEIEKADSQLLNIFLQVFDAGRLTDARGNVIDFSHTTIILTSNIGTSLFSRSQMGYSGDLEGGSVSHASLLKALKKYFSPEFLNRLDEILIFNHLSHENVKKIIDIQLESTRERFEKMQKELVIKDDVLDYVIEHGYSKEYGARHIGRTLKNAILEKIAHTSLEKEWEYTRQVVCTMDNGKVCIHLETEAVESLSDPELMEQAKVEISGGE